MTRILAALVIAGTACGAEVLMQLEQPEASWRVLVGETASGASRDQVASFLRTAKQPLAVMIVAETERAAYRVTGKGSTDVGYLAWRNRLGPRTADHSCSPTLYGLRIGSNSALRSVDAACRTAQVHVTGSGDPFEICANGTKGRLLHVHIEKTRLGKPPLWVQYFIVTDSHLSKERALAFLRELQRAAPMPNASVAVRGDPWFITSERFPMIYELEGHPGSLPTKKEFERAPQVNCGAMSNSTANCWVGR